MPPVIFKNLANLIVVFRSLLVFVIIILLSNMSPALRITGLALLIFIAILDWLDGYIARRLRISSKLGGLMDTLGDRITENLFLIFFAYKRLMPVAVPIIFVARSLIADFIRHYSSRNGMSTFAINKSKLGMFFVASKPSRVLYLIFKIVIFCLAALALVVSSLIVVNGILELRMFLVSLRHIVFHGSIALVAFNLLRFILLTYDSRFVLKDVFANGY